MNVKESGYFQSEYSFLVARFNKQVMKINHSRLKKQPNRKSKSFLISKLLELLDEFIIEDQTITIRKVASEIDVSDKTLRRYGLHDVIKQKKVEQKEQRYANYIQDTKAQIDQFMQLKENICLSMKEIYKLLGLSQTYLTTYAPEINEYIYEWRAMTKWKKECSHE